MSVTNGHQDERASVQLKDTVPGIENLSAEQQELLRDMRASLKQMKRGDLLPARETLREIEQEQEADDNARISDA